MPSVAVTIVTYRRHEMLKRAISSVLAQTHRDITIAVVNDDPADAHVETIIAGFDDPRCTLFRPVEKRGATRNFNIVFQETSADYAALLEDDNWWEPTFLASQIAVLERFSDAPLVVGNERVWRELPDGGWRDMETTIWPFRDVRLHTFTLAGICGSATICNSSMLIRVRRSSPLLTPATIPVDVTEHFRERLLPTTIPLNGEPLVNYAETIGTARGGGERWGLYQAMLIGSVFAALPDAAARRRLAGELWKGVVAGSPRSTALVCAGLAVVEARALVARAPAIAVARAAATLARRPRRVAALARVRRDKWDEFGFLVAAPLTRALAGDAR